MNDMLTVDAVYDLDGRVSQISVRMPDGATYDDVGATVRMLARALSPELRDEPPLSAAATVVMHTPAALDPLDPNTNLADVWPVNR